MTDGEHYPKPADLYTRDIMQNCTVSPCHDEFPSEKPKIVCAHIVVFLPKNENNFKFRNLFWNSSFN